MNWRGRGAGSALGRLETFQANSILNAAAILGKPLAPQAQTCPVGLWPSGEQARQLVDTPAWLQQASLIRWRTHSYSVGIEDLGHGRVPPRHMDMVWNMCAEKIEHQVTLEELQHLNTLFQVGTEQEYEKRGRQLLDMETFKCIMKQSMRLQNKSTEQIEQLFMKIDYEAVGGIQWDGFCTYLQLVYSEQAEALARQKEVSFQLPAVLQGLSYGGPVLCILSVPDDTLIMIREDGAIYFWSLQLKLKRRKRVFDKPIIWKRRWVTDATGMPQYNKLIVGTGNREIQLYELSNLGPYCQISGLEAVPLKLDYWYEDPDKCLILYGDDQGCVNILFLASVGELLRKPTGILKSHTSPVIYIHVSAEDNKMFSMSTDSTIKIWDLETDSCLFTTSSKASGIRGEPRACLYLPDPRALCVAADTVALLHLRLRSPCEPALAVSHKEPVVCCRYNPTFKQVVSCSEASPPELWKKKCLLFKLPNLWAFVMAALADRYTQVVKVWNCETGRLLFEFIGSHSNAGITCMTFDSNGRRLVTGGRDGCLKIWSYNNGHCLHTLKHDEKQSEVCDCTYLEVNQNKCIIAVGWDRRINVYLDTPCDFHHFRKPQPHWQDDLDHGHKEDILCVAQCPPFLLATSSYDGEIIIWNVISGHMCCKLNTPSPSDSSEDREGLDRSVSCLTFLKTRAANLESAAASLIANGPQGSITFWRLFGRTCPIASFTPSKDKVQVSSLVVTAGDARAYVADQHGFVRVYDIKEYGLWEPEPEPPKNAMFWRAHVSTVTSLELIKEEKFLLSSSLDHTVRLWSVDGEYIGTFGQSSPWDIFTPASWSQSGVPCDVLTDPQSMPARPALERGVSTTLTGEEEQEKVVEGKAGAKPGETSNPRSPEDSVLEVDVKEDIHQWDAFCSHRPPLEQSEPSLGVPSIYQTLWCHEVACMSALGEKPDLSILGADLFNLDFLAQEKEGREAAQKEY